MFRDADAGGDEQKNNWLSDVRLAASTVSVVTSYRQPYAPMYLVSKAYNQTFNGPGDYTVMRS